MLGLGTSITTKISWASLADRYFLLYLAKLWTRRIRRRSCGGSLMTGMPSLLADSSLEVGGLHQSSPVGSSISTSTSPRTITTRTGTDG